jgi:hypothetical protein
MRLPNAPCRPSCSCPLCDSEMLEVLAMASQKDKRAYAAWLNKSSKQYQRMRAAAEKQAPPPPRPNWPVPGKKAPDDSRRKFEEHLDSQKRPIREH